MRGACIMRNYSHYRFEVRTCQNLDFNEDIENATNKLRNPVGLIRTRASMGRIEKAFKKVGNVDRRDSYLNLRNGVI